MMSLLSARSVVKWVVSERTKGIPGCIAESTRMPMDSTSDSRLSRASERSSRLVCSVVVPANASTYSFTWPLGGCSVYRASLSTGRSQTSLPSMTAVRPRCSRSDHPVLDSVRSSSRSSRWMPWASCWLSP